MTRAEAPQHRNGSKSQGHGPQTAAHGPQSSESPKPAYESPKANEAELAVLGSILLEPWRLDEIAAIVRPDDFFQQDMADAFRAAQTLRERNKPVNQIAIAEQVQKHKGEVNVQRLVDAMEAVPHAAHATYHANQVREASLRRKVLSEALQMCVDSRDWSKSLEDLTNSMDRTCRAVQERTVGEHIDPTAPDRLLDVLEMVLQGREHGLNTGYFDLDRLTNGLKPESLIIIAARPSMGKTAFVANVALNIAKKGSGVLMFSLEQSYLEITERLLALQSGFGLHILQGGGLEPLQREKIIDAANQIGDCPLWIDDVAASMAQIGARSRMLARKGNLKLVIVDYLQIVEPEDRRAPREQQVSLISRQLKRLAKELKVPVIALAQMNRGIEARADKRPMLADLRESGAIEQDADVVIFLHRPGFYDRELENQANHEAQILVTKHRNGKTGDVKLEFVRHLMQFRNSALDHQVASDPIGPGEYFAPVLYSED